MEVFLCNRDTFRKVRVKSDILKLETKSFKDDADQMNNDRWCCFFSSSQLWIIVFYGTPSIWIKWNFYHFLCGGLFWLLLKVNQYRPPPISLGERGHGLEVITIFSITYSIEFKILAKDSVWGKIKKFSQVNYVVQSTWTSFGSLFFLVLN